VGSVSFRGQPRPDAMTSFTTGRTRRPSAALAGEVGGRSSANPRPGAESPNRPSVASSGFADGSGGSDGDGRCRVLRASAAETLVGRSPRTRGPTAGTSQLTSTSRVGETCRDAPSRLGAQRQSGFRGFPPCAPRPWSTRKDSTECTLDRRLSVSTFETTAGEPYGAGRAQRPPITFPATDGRTGVLTSRRARD
jgi:hypothetical protein